MPELPRLARLVRIIEIAADANPSADIFGGRLLAQMKRGGAKTPLRSARDY